MPVDYLVSPGSRFHGRVRVPGDKSVSHRAIMLGSIADGVTEVSGFLNGADSLATLNAFREMGVAIEQHDDHRLSIHGAGLHGLSAPDAAIDLGNSGTAMRLMMGLLSGQTFDSELVGDDSLQSRPMARVQRPLAQMGAGIALNDGCAPVQITGGMRLAGIDYHLPVASAQLKSALLLAGLYADGQTTVTEPAPTRDHTERMLRGLGCEVVSEVAGDGNRVMIRGGQRLTATSIDVPSDISSATFPMIAALIASDSELVLEHVGVNSTRDGVIRILRHMGAKIVLENPRQVGGEPVADIRVSASRLRGIEVKPEWVPLAIDELPAVAIAAACAEGQTLISGAEELRVKESDRIDATVRGLRGLGVEVEERDDGMLISGCVDAAAFHGGEVESYHDHRISMAFSLAGLRSTAPVKVLGCDNIDTSFPGYAALMTRLGLDIRRA